MKPIKHFFILAVVATTSVLCGACGNQPVDPNLELIEIVTKPKKLSYKVGEKFDPTGMKVEATYKDGVKQFVEDYKYEPSGALTKEDKKINVSFYGKSTDLSISVRAQGGGDDSYYADIDPDSTTLLKDLNSLNTKKRTRTVGYKPMLNTPDKGYYVTDPGNGPNTITTFYSGKSNNGTGGLNREHVWPDSRGGGSVQNDIHMTRPTLNSENGNRGNSFYVEGKCKPAGGWDPAMTSFGLESYRGDSARIIFYCAIANTTLTLVDKDDDKTSNKTMGKLSDLLKWNLEYEVLDREMVRNDGAEQLQGNRNPFIDHPEYACKIWGTVSAETRRVCGL